MLGDKLSEKNEKIKKRKVIKDNESDDSDEDEERALFAKTFKGRCRKCGKFEHKAVDCRSYGGFKHNNNNNNNNNNNKGRINNNCGRFQGKFHQMEQEEEVALVGFSLKADNEPQNNEDNQGPNQVQDEPRPREAVANRGGYSRKQTCSKKISLCTTRNSITKTQI